MKVRLYEYLSFHINKGNSGEFEALACNALK